MEVQRKRVPWLEYGLLLIAYVAIRVPDIWAVDAFAELIFPLNFLYFAKLLFSGAVVNPAIADTVIAPANASLIYPPGIYILSAALGSVRNTFYFLFVIQAFVPLLIFRLIRPLAPKLFSFTVAVLLTYYCTSARTWYPDFIIQPLMAGVLVLIFARDRQLGFLQLTMCGLGSGLIVLLKHNVGIFFVVLCGTLIFFRSCSFSAERSGRRGFVYFLLMGFFSFGLIFLFKLPHWDEVVFYLFPYFGFWLYISNLIYRQKLHLDSTEFIKRGVSYGVIALALPLLVFIQFGGVIGFKRYWYSLFGMGFEHIAFWDNGIWGMVRPYLNLGGLWAVYSSAIVLVALVGPFFVNLASVSQLYKNNMEDHRKRLERIQATSLGVMSVFMLFPLEDHKIALSKFFVFIVVFVMLLRSASARTWRYLGLVTLVMLVPVSYISWRNLQYMTRVPTLIGNPVLQEVIGLPLDKNVVQELDAQMAVLQRSAKGAPYFVLTSPAYNLLTLPILVDNIRPQYYVRFDSAAVSNDVVKSTITVISEIPYVVVATGDYQDYLAGKTENTSFHELMIYVAREFAVVDEYSGTSKNSLATRHIDGFLVLKKKLPGN